MRRTAKSSQWAEPCVPLRFVTTIRGKSCAPRTAATTLAYWIARRRLARRSLRSPRLRALPTIARSINKRRRHTTSHRQAWVESMSRVCDKPPDIAHHPRSAPGNMSMPCSGLRSATGDVNHAPMSHRLACLPMPQTTPGQQHKGIDLKLAPGRDRSAINTSLRK